MPAHPWRADSLFGDGPRTVLNRDQIRILRQRLRNARLARWITSLHELVGLELLQLLGPANGRLDPAQETLAHRVGCCARTVSTALRRFRKLGLLAWVRRLVRVDQRVRQTSNAYAFRPDTAVPEAFRCDRKPCREANSLKNPTLPFVSEADRTAAIAALERVQRDRQAAVVAAWTTRRR